MGGQSSRMGTDKSQLKLNDQTLTQIAFEKLKCYVDDIHYSINESQNDLNLENKILDEFAEQGPLGGIISSLRATQQSILVLAVDMPNIRKQTIKQLITHRDWNLLSTTHYDPAENIWQPFPSIWEIEALPCLEEYFESGERSFQKFLNKFGHQQVPITDKSTFLNMNTKEDFEKLKIQNQISF